MTFAGNIAGSSLAGSSDVQLSGLANDQVLTYDGTSSKWQNKTAASASLTNVPMTAVKSGSTWPVRPTTNASTVVFWVGADPSPAIVSSGTGGMYNNDVRVVPS